MMELEVKWKKKLITMLCDWLLFATLTIYFSLDHM